MLKKLIMATILITLFGLSNADPCETRVCRQVIAAVNFDHPPYAIHCANNEVTGVAVELAHKIFAELDIPLKIVVVPNTIELHNDLLVGDIDLVLATHDSKDSREVLSCLEPAYINYPSKVFMAFSNSSPCNIYKAYLKKRLTELKADGTIDLYMRKYGSFKKRRAACAPEESADKLNYGERENSCHDLSK